VADHRQRIMQHRIIQEPALDAQIDVLHAQIDVQ
jgi:hypothetical protein